MIKVVVVKRTNSVDFNHLKTLQKIMVNKIEELFEIHEQKTFLAMSLILTGPFYENKNDATITRQILTSTEDIKSWPYGNDVITVDFFHAGLILMKVC